MGRDKQKYLIIGAGAAGLAAASAIRQADQTGSITVLSAEADPPYFRPMIPFIVSGGKTAEAIRMEGCGPFWAGGMAIYLGKKVRAVEPETNRVVLAGGEALSYDKLLIASGSRPALPGHLAADPGKGIFTFRTLADARAMAHHLPRTGQAVLLGAGILNIKAAFALLERGIEITMVELEKSVLPRLMDAEGAALFHDILRGKGIRLITGRTIARIEANDGGVNGVMLDDGQHICCQMVCIGTGVRPNAEFLESSNIAAQEGVVVDHFTQSSAAGVYAAGDVAMTTNPDNGEKIISGLWTNAVAMGRCAGFNMAGRRSAYGGALTRMNAAQVADTPFVSMGVVHTEGSGCEVHVSKGQQGYRKLVFSADGNYLTGALFIGDIDRAGIYRQIICGRRPVRAIKKELISHRIHYGHCLHRGMPGSG